MITFFTRQAIAKPPFFLHFTYKKDTTCQVWFNLDNSKTQTKTNTVKICYSGSSQVSVLKLKFFRSQAIAKVFLSYTLPTKGDTP